MKDVVQLVIQVFYKCGWIMDTFALHVKSLQRRNWKKRSNKLLRQQGRKYISRRESSCCLGFWQDFILMLFYPCKISINQRFGLQLPPMLPFSGFQPRKLIINFINCPDLL